MIGKVTENFDVLISRAQKFQSWWSFHTCSGDKLDIAACHCAGVSKAGQALENGLSDIRNQTSTFPSCLRFVSRGRDRRPKSTKAVRLRAA